MKDLVFLGFSPVLLPVLLPFFRHTKLSDRWVFKKKIFNFGLKVVVEKCVGCFLVYLFYFFFGGGGVIKKWSIHDSLRTHCYPYFSVFWWLKRVYARNSCQKRCNTHYSAATPNNVNEKVIFKNSAPFSNCRSRINNTQVDDAHDIDAVISCII